MKTNYIDKQVRRSFNQFLKRASHLDVLGDIAKHPYGRQEATIERIFRENLTQRLEPDIEILLDQYKEAYGPKHDIVGKYRARTAVVVEVKTPFTNSGGIPHKTKRPLGLPKDMNSLKQALRNGVPLAYELVVMFECYALDKKGNIMVLADSINRNERALKDEYGIRWPTKLGYDPHEGEQEVNEALKNLARKHNLRLRRKGWRSVELPPPNPNILSFIDCALYKVQLK